MIDERFIGTDEWIAEQARKWNSRHGASTESIATSPDVSPRVQQPMIEETQIFGPAIPEGVDPNSQDIQNPDRRFEYVDPYVGPEQPPIVQKPQA